MSETKEKDVIIKNLKYLGLDLENIPNFLTEYKDVDYKPTKAYEQTDFRVYKYVKLNDIQILLTPTNRLNSVGEKYAKAVPLKDYLDSQDERNILKHASFLKMLEKLDKNEIDKIEEEQLSIKNQIPFRVKFSTNYLWEIYYSEFTDKYFMMLTTEDQNYNAFFYLLKKQIECAKTGKEEYIFVPINYLDYTKKYLKKSEIADIEKYIWLFTKDWPNVYEVFDINNNLSVQIVGTTIVYDKIKSYYKIQLNNKEDATKFYTLLKALFILQTELPHHYQFDTQLDENGALIFELNNKVINYQNLSKFIKDEYKKNAEELQKIFEDKEKIDIQVEKLKEEELEKNKEYLFKEKQVATYLECRKSVFGKIKYFFRNKNGKFVKAKAKTNNIKKVKEENEIEKSVSNAIIEEKELYTIEDLIKICIELDRINIKMKDTKLDIAALEDKIKIVEGKIKNATLFIEQIEEHKKSIFEFWKFANKDVAVGLNPGKEEEKEQKPKKIKRAFDYEEDVEDIGVEADNIQRNLFSENEINSLYLATTNLIDDINKIRNDEKITKESLQSIKKAMKNEGTELDIFGNIKNDRTKISVLANKKHRESEKDKYKILDLPENVVLEEYEDKLKKESSLIEQAIRKTKAIADMDIYCCSNDKLNLTDIKLFYINPSDAIKKQKNMEKVSLYKIRIKEGMNIVYNTNIIYYDNFNHTLPIGMNVNQTVTFDMSEYKIDLKKQKIFRINEDDNNFSFKEKIICAYEYEAKSVEVQNDALEGKEKS